MKCPKCKTANLPGAKECDYCGVIFAHIRGNEVKVIDADCPWNDHGVVCGKRGSMSDNTRGEGPWYCSEHYWKLKGQTSIPVHEKQLSFRERWYAEHGLPYEPAKLGDFGGWKCVGTIKPVRESGDDFGEK